MGLNLSERQRTMLTHMGVRLDFLPPAKALEATPMDPTTALAPVAPERTVSSGASPASKPLLAQPPAPTPVVQTRPAANVPPQPVRRADIAQADWAQLQEAVSACTACGLCQTRQRTVFGVGSTPAADAPIDVMIIGEAPGEQEDLRGEPFVGAAGQLLDQMLTALGWSRQAQGGPAGRVFIANVLKCRPPGNRNPHADEVAQCLPFLQRQIELVQPKVLLAMGRFGAQALLAAHMPAVEGTPLGKLRGQIHTHQGIPLVVTYHPAYLLRSPSEKGKVWADLCLAQSLLPTA